MATRMQWLICWIVCFFSLNPIFQSLGIRGTMLLLVLVVLTLSSNRLRYSRVHTVIYLLLLLFIASSLLSAIFNNTLQPLIFAFFFGLTTLTVLQTSEAQARTMVQMASRAFALFLVLAALGVAYQLLGGTPLLTLVNADGRENHLYLTTFSNAEAFTIRPSAIYDEPGAFSFYICVLVIFRSRLRLPLAGSAALLLGGLITQSITHIIFTLIWFIWVLQRRDAKVLATQRSAGNRLGFALVFGLAALAFYQSGLLDWTLERAVFFYENPWANPRQRSLDDILQALAVRPDAVWFGFDDACVQRSPDCSGLGENPLTPLTYGGLFASWPYYVFLLVALLAPFLSRDGLLLTGAAVLLMQRPYLLEFPYSALAALGLLVWFAPSARLKEGTMAPHPID